MESCFRISVFIFTRREQFLHSNTHKRINPADLKLLRGNYGRESNSPKSAAVKRINLKCPCSSCLPLPERQPQSKQLRVWLEFLLLLFSCLKSKILAVSNVPTPTQGCEVKSHHEQHLFFTHSCTSAKEWPTFKTKLKPQPFCRAPGGHPPSNGDFWCLPFGLGLDSPMEDMPRLTNPPATVRQWDTISIPHPARLLL